MAENTDQILDDAIARNVGAVLSLPSAGMLRHYKSRFLAPANEGFWIEGAREDRALIDDLIARKQPAALSFKSSTAKTSFAATIIRREEAFEINAETTVEALLIHRPGQIKTVQRRNDYRVRVTETSEVACRIWRIAEQADLRQMPIEAQSIKSQLRDLSLGGMGITVIPPPPKDPPKDENEPKFRLLMDERLRIEFVNGEQQLLIEGRVRHLPIELRDGLANATQSFRVGVKFDKLESAMEGRQALATLTRLIGQLQRDEIRRLRMGLTTRASAA